jgi:dihydropteroate synthase
MPKAWVFPARTSSSIRASASGKGIFTTCCCRHLDRLVEMGFPVLMGHSRKSFIGRILAGTEAEAGPIPPPDQRLFGSLAVVADSYYRGARLFRVHDVRETRELLDVCHGIATAGD